MEQQQLAEAHLNLVDRVIRKEIKVSGLPLQTYEDYYQEGCMALCKAAARYQPERGRFESLAYTVVKNALIDYSKYQTRWRVHEQSYPQEGDPDYLPFLQMPDTKLSPEECTQVSEASDILEQCRDRYKGAAQKGLEVICRRYDGEEIKEVANSYGVPAQRVQAWVRRGREVLQKDRTAMAQLGMAA